MSGLRNKEWKLEGGGEFAIESWYKGIEVLSTDSEGAEFYSYLSWDDVVGIHEFLGELLKRRDPDE